MRFSSALVFYTEQHQLQHTEQLGVTMKRPRLCVAFGGRIVVFSPSALDTTAVGSCVHTQVRPARKIMGQRVHK
jgi:hypothetical protein